MKSIYLFELKKIFSRKIVWAGIFLVFAVSVGRFSYISGQDVSYEQELAAKYEGILDDTKVQQMLQDFMPTQEQLDMWKGPVYAIGLNSMQSAVHRFFANEDGTWNGKTVADVFGNQKIKVGYYAGWMELSRNLIAVMVTLAIVSVIMTAPVFAGEYSGMDNILLTSRYGRTKCAAAKILAALTAVLSLTFLFLAGNLAAALISMGTYGLDASTMFCGISYENYLPYNVSCGTMLLYQIGLSVSGIIMLTGITLFISAVSKTQLVSLILSTAVFLGPMLFSMDENSSLFWIVGFLPVYQLQFSSLMSLGTVKGDVFYAAAAFPVTVVVLAAGIVLTRKFWASHQTVS